MSQAAFLCLGGGDGWHADQLQRAANHQNCRLDFATYESLQATIDDGNCQLRSAAGSLGNFAAILTRTMPTGTLEQVTFRLAMLHQCRSANNCAIVNPPSSLEKAIDKFATLAQVARLGYQVPPTMVVQSRREAMEAFRSLGGDCVVKPIFGGEGRGVMRLHDEELAWYTFSTLDQLGAVHYIQQFVPPGGRDTRLLVIGDEVLGLHRQNDVDFRTNALRGGRPRPFCPTADQCDLAMRVCASLELKFAAVDLIDTIDGDQLVLEVNAIPGWKGAQSVIETNIATLVIRLLRQQALLAEARC